MVKSLFLTAILTAISVNNAVSGGVVNGSQSTKIVDTNVYGLDLIGDFADSNISINGNGLQYGYTYNTGFKEYSNGVINSSVSKYFNTEIVYGMPGVVFSNYTFDYRYTQTQYGLVPMWFNNNALYDVLNNHAPFYFSSVAFYSSTYSVLNSYDGFQLAPNVNYTRGLDTIVINTSMLGFYNITLNLLDLEEMEYLSLNANISTQDISTWTNLGIFWGKEFDINTLFGGNIKPYFNKESLVYAFTISFSPYASLNPTDFNGVMADIFDNGWRAGYQFGLEEGISQGNNFTFMNLFNSIANTPVLYLRALFNFEFFGIKIYQVVLGLITALILVWVVKKVV